MTELKTTKLAKTNVDRVMNNVLQDIKNNLPLISYTKSNN